MAIGACPGVLAFCQQNNVASEAELFAEAIRRADCLRERRRTMRRLVTCLAGLFFASLATAPSLAQGTRDQYMGWWDSGWGMGHMFFGGLFMLIFWGGIILLIVFLVRWLSLEGRATRPPSSARPAALEILQERFAKGEIDKKEYEERRRTLLSD